MQVKSVTDFTAGGLVEIDLDLGQPAQRRIQQPHRTERQPTASGDRPFDRDQVDLDLATIGRITHPAPARGRNQRRFDPEPVPGRIAERGNRASQQSTAARLRRCGIGQRRNLDFFGRGQGFLGRLHNSRLRRLAFPNRCPQKRYIGTGRQGEGGKQDQDKLFHTIEATTFRRADQSHPPLPWQVSAPRFTPMTAPLIDPFQRAITYLRVSVTDRCDFRCAYCMSENMTFLPKKELLTLEELDRMCSSFIRLGVEKLRITGGEPLVRRGIMSFFDAMSRHLDSGALKELTLTTNGSQLEKFAGDLWAAGVRRVNISLDTLDETKFAEITRWGRLPQVLRGIDAAQKAGMRVKINAVALKGFNDVELFDLVDWCHGRDIDLTFIEVMPMGDIGNEDRLDQYWPLSDLRAQLADRFTLTDLAERSGGPARYVRLDETGQKIGFITPLTHNFCESCNRVRLTCTGEIYTCLGQEGMQDLRPALRDHPGDDAPLEQAIRAAIGLKPKGHDFDYSRQDVAGKMSRHMSHTGG